MKILLEYPYTTKWKNGYLVTNRENRKHVILYNSDQDRSSTSYARYLVSVNLGRFLNKCEEVDHINNDKSDDRLINLQILTPEENIKKQSRYKGRLLAELICPMCSDIFLRRKGNTQAVPCKKGKVTCCSKECSNLFMMENLNRSEREAISTRTLLRVFRCHK